MLKLNKTKNSINGDLNHSNNNLTSLENNNINEVTGNFDCRHNHLENLKGMPEQIGQDFNCSYNKLNSLEGCPEIIVGEFNCSNNQLKTLEYSPKEVNWVFNCSFNKLQNLKGSTKIIGNSFLCYNNELTSLEGRPKLIKGDFICKNNPELKNIKEQIIKYQIKAEGYWTDEGAFSFKEISVEFNKYKRQLMLNNKIKIKQEKQQQYKEKIIKKTKKINNNLDYGLSL